jgi:hypothetical protein
MTVTSFLPSNYEVPVSTGGNYFKKKEGANRLRMISHVVTGYSYWTDDKKCIRSQKPIKGTPSDIGSDQDGKQNKVKHFWACLVWDYADSKIKIWEIEQATIQTKIANLALNDEWGDPREYDLLVTYKKSAPAAQMYDISPCKEKPLSQEQNDSIANSEISIDAWYEKATGGGGSNKDRDEEDHDLTADELHKKYKFQSTEALCLWAVTFTQMSETEIRNKIAEMQSETKDSDGNPVIDPETQRPRTMMIPFLEWAKVITTKPSSEDIPF